MAAQNSDLNRNRRDFALSDLLVKAERSLLHGMLATYGEFAGVERFNDMKLLIGYDGSKCADDALDGLKNAGLPRKAETTVLCIAEVSPLPPPSSLLLGSVSSAVAAHAHCSVEVVRQAAIPKTPFSPHEAAS